MAISTRSKVVAALAAALALLVLVTTTVWRNGPGPAAAPHGIRHGAPDTRADRAGSAGTAEHGFHEAALESGIDFRMNFLATEQGEKFKINLYDHGCGVAVGDCDGNGRDDIYLLNQLGPNALYRNGADGTFHEITQQAGGLALEDRISVGATFADYDNEGFQDLYVTSTRGGNVLFRNLGAGQFKDVTREAGLTCIAHSQTAAFFYFDNDGNLDLFLTNSAQWTTDAFDETLKYYPGRPQEIFSSAKEFNVLYRNNGDLTFSDITDEAGLRGLGWGGDVAVLDFDGDGFLDLYVTNMFGTNLLYRNLGDGRFSDVTAETLGRTSFGATGVKAFDFNNDGLLDLLVVDMHSDMWMNPAMMPALTASSIVEKRKYTSIYGPRPDYDPQARDAEMRTGDLFGVEYDKLVFGNTLFKNLGNGRFEEVSDRTNMETFWPWGIATGDFDNDGYEDAYIPSGMGYPFFYWPSRLMMNNGDETFTERPEAEGIEPPARGIYLEQKIGGKPACRSSRCAATADFDGDGRLDIIVNNFNDHPYYFKNGFPKRNYAAFRLKGVASNADATGALVKLYVGNEIMVRQVHAAGGYLSQSSKIVHFGLGDRSAIDRVEIRWPNGTSQ